VVSANGFAEAQAIPVQQQHRLPGDQTIQGHRRGSGFTSKELGRCLFPGRTAGRPSRFGPDVASTSSIGTLRSSATCNLDPARPFRPHPAHRRKAGRSSTPEDRRREDRRLADLLEEPEDNTRYRVRAELRDQ
jgi:hypothetical protein